ncbi:hypothetical protein KAU86_05040 [bacterium]|nr:hypothetical protein [bacterium]MCK4437296.1 hypothetical protein [bacterium]
MKKLNAVGIISPHPRIMVEECKLSILLAKDKNKYCALCPELDLVTSMKTPETTADDMLEEIKEYAHEYMGDFDVYSKSPNRAHHLPYVEAVVSCKNDWELRMLTEVKYGFIHV